MHTVGVVALIILGVLAFAGGLIWVIRKLSSFEVD